MDINVKFNDECEWGWEDWVESYVKAVLMHADVKATEIYAETMDEDNINLIVKERDPNENRIVEREYCLHYVDDTESMIGLLFFYSLFRREGDGYLYLYDYGAYKVIRSGGACQCVSLDDLIR